jgi:hypothetical protein
MVMGVLVKKDSPRIQSARVPWNTTLPIHVSVRMSHRTNLLDPRAVESQNRAANAGPSRLEIPA